MVIGVLQLDLHLYGPQSLKEKRGVVQKLLARGRNHFPASCAEVGHQNLWQRTLLGFAIVSTSEQLLAPILSRIEEDLLSTAEVELIDAVTEFIHY